MNSRMKVAMKNYTDNAPMNRRMKVAIVNYTGNVSMNLRKNVAIVNYTGNMSMNLRKTSKHPYPTCALVRKIGDVFLEWQRNRTLFHTTKMNEQQELHSITPALLRCQTRKS